MQQNEPRPMNVNAPPSGILETATQAFLARWEGLTERLPGPRAPREAAAAAFRDAGLPAVRNEAWKYTSLRPMAELSFHEPLTSFVSPDGLLGRLPDLSAPRLVFVDGRWREDLSVPPERVAFAPFSEHPDFGALTHPERQSLVALNTMLAEDGALISVPDGVDGGTLLLVSLASEAGGRPVAFHPRHAIRLGRGARLSLLEIAVGQGVYLHNPVTEVQVAEDATLIHARLQEESTQAFHLSTVYAEVARGGTYDSFALNIGARICRTEIHARMTGERAAVHLNGAQTLRGLQHADFTTVIAHDAPHCASRQTVKNVLAGRSRGVFQGRIEVARGAQKTDGYQMNQALLLSPEAEVDSKPELEIFADDVKCSHGATVGELDQDQLFYLRSRGIPQAEARGILVRAFLEEALAPIEHEGIRSAMEQALERWWGEEAP